MVIAKTSLTSAEHERVCCAIVSAQQRTNAKFNLVVVPYSDRYALFPLIWAAVVSLSATGVLAILHPNLSIGKGVSINTALFIIFAVILDWLPLRLLLVPPFIKRIHARHLAHREFAAHVLAGSEHRNSVLLFVSLGERYVEILADREIHNRTAAGTWEKITNDFIAAMHAHRLADGLINAIEACAAVLAEHYPQ